MPGLTTASTSPGPSSHFPTVRSRDDMTTANAIKDKAKEDAHRIARGATSKALLNVARIQTAKSREAELAGDLRSALACATRAASLITMFMESSEYEAEQKQLGQKGSLHQALIEFRQHDGSDLIERMQSLDAKLTQTEQNANSEPARKPAGTSIADRMRALQENGLEVSATKRFSRDLKLPSVPQSPPGARRPQIISQPSSTTTSVAPLPAVSSRSTSSVPSTPILSAPTPPLHVLVPTSSLGPPSPTSSTSSSPKLDEVEFSQNFPPIDELDGLANLQIGSMTNATSNNQPVSSTSVFNPLPLRSSETGTKPPSRPISPSILSTGRPESPLTSPRSPTIVKKPSGLGFSSFPPPDPPSSATKPFSAQWSSLPTSPPLPSKSLNSSASHPLPMSNLIDPRTLRDYLSASTSRLNILLIDVRTREKFQQERIKAPTIMCLEPSILERERVDGEMLEDALCLGPKEELSLFQTRDIFDLIVLYDDASETFGPSNSHMSILTRAIYENAFRKFLKNMPALLVGGLYAWKRDVGVDYLEVALSVLAQQPSSNGQVNTTVNFTSTSTSMPHPTPLPPSVQWTTSSASSSAALASMSHASSSSHSSSRPRADTTPQPPVSFPSSVRHSIDVTSPRTQHLSYGAKSINGFSETPSPVPRWRDSISHSPSPLPPSVPENSIAQPYMNGITSKFNGPVQYPSTPFSHSSTRIDMVSPPPPASINPVLSRRRSDYIDQSQEALGNHASRPPIGYPELQVLRPPPAVASSVLERQQTRPPPPIQAPPPPLSTLKLQTEYPPTYWGDVDVGMSGLQNLGNTCYMSSTLQCLSATVPFANFFKDNRYQTSINMVNPLGHKGTLATAFAHMLRSMWQSQPKDRRYLDPRQFRAAIVHVASQFAGKDQHDSQEFLSILLDGLHEDLNRVLRKPEHVVTKEREEELERLPQPIASDQEWTIYRMRNDSVIVDFFQGQFRNRMQCLTCNQTSTTYNAFMYLTLPVPEHKRSASLKECLDLFVKKEVMEKEESWHCPKCKSLRRATKQLSLSRLPPVLLIHLKRFSFTPGSATREFSDKVKTLVDFPLRGLDLTDHMPPPLPAGADKMQLNEGRPMSADDPRVQTPPYRYDLYGVANHHSQDTQQGHYTAYVASRGQWYVCNDSAIDELSSSQVVTNHAYILFYKRIKC